MNWRNVAEISQDVYWVGARDWNRKLFDALIPLPKGTTYNSYVVVGADKKALIDTVNPGFEKELEEKIGKILNPADIDYVVMNHAEPDHAGSIPHIMSICKKATLVTTSKGAKMAQTYFNVPESKTKIVADGDILDLGGKKLRFIEAPMLHWPETMFTYLEKSKILFSCDFLGSHVAMGLYDDDVDDLLVHAQRYFGEIMMPFRVMGQKALDKIKDIDIEIIAPSHGSIHRNPQRILDAYRRWTNGETKRKAIVVYASMWGNTEKMVRLMADTLATEGIETAVYNLAVSDIGDVAKDLVDSRAIVLGTPTVLTGAHPLALYAAYLVKALKPPAKYGVVLSSYGWGGGAVKQIQETLSPTKMEIAGAIEINGPPTEADLTRISELSKTLAAKINEEA